MKLRIVLPALAFSLAACGTQPQAESGLNDASRQYELSPEIERVQTRAEFFNKTYDLKDDAGKPSKAVTVALIIDSSDKNSEVYNSNYVKAFNDLAKTKKQGAAVEISLIFADVAGMSTEVESTKFRDYLVNEYEPKASDRSIPRLYTFYPRIDGKRAMVRKSLPGFQQQPTSAVLQLSGFLFEAGRIVSYQQFKEMRKANPEKNYMVAMTATWCGACSQQKDSMTKVVAKLGISLSAVVLYIDSDQDSEFKTEYNVQSLPTSVIYKAGVDAPASKQVGMLSYEKLLAILTPQ